MLALLLAGCAQPRATRAPRASSADVARWEARAANVTITRDEWGIAHVHGKSDSDAVFGMIYAQAEDDFPRIEMNYLDSQGRRAEAEGESAVFRDLRMKLFVREDSLRAQYAASPEWLRALMDAWADGLNFYLYNQPAVKPKVIAHFEPWMALSFTEGSIGGDIETISLEGLTAFYGDSAGDSAASRLAAAEETLPLEPTGSNGIAIAPSRTRDGHALLLINPHTTLFFRDEMQVTSDEGLNAYGAVTWGQFFVYQGFNERAGWMHTSSGVDVIDEWAEDIQRRPDGLWHRRDDLLLPVKADTIVVPYRTPQGMAQRTFTVFRTSHGPVVRAENGRWISVGLMHEPVKSLTESFARTKARTYAEYREVMELRANSSNNTVFASADGDIAYFHGNFVPRRDRRFDWKKPVDGANPRTDWQGLHEVGDMPNLLNPKSGWLYNSNNWPYSAAGRYSPKRSRYPAYMEKGGESPRGVHALRVLEGGKDFTLESLRDAAFDSWQPGFATLVPSLVAAFDRLPARDSLRGRLEAPVDSLRAWDYRWSVSSVPTSLAVFWGDELWRQFTPAANAANMAVYDYLVTRTTPAEKLAALVAATDTMVARFGFWKMEWGEINRYQRRTGDIVQHFDDAAPSRPVGFTSGRWGSLASFAPRTGTGTKMLYGTSGNSFVAVVEFGARVRALAVTAGGVSGDTLSPHFNDQAARYCSGDLRPVYFYPAELAGHTEREYHPGK
jgi:acyl-homoserine-lactone acylase